MLIYNFVDLDHGSVLKDFSTSTALRAYPELVEGALAKSGQAM
jgi:hypothetical protein